MNTTDPIADLLTRIRNATSARKDIVRIPYSKVKHQICDVLVENGYIESAKAIGEGVAKEIQVELKEGQREIHLRRVSKPGQRIYVSSKEIPKVLEGLGIAIISTPKGIITGKEARKQNVGGEYLCEVY